MKLICKQNHNTFTKGDMCEGIDIPNGVMIIHEKDQKKYFYGLKRLPHVTVWGEDFIETWFWTLEEWRDIQLKIMLD